ncbi:MAG: dipeptide epimerase [Sphingobacteriaceae bacterium]|nr:dipeptide epimerase [Sphingobacteriaceae bacterium]
MQAQYKTFDLLLKHTFSIANFSRNHTPVVLLKLLYEGCEGFGEASMVPYLGENSETAIDFLNKVDWQNFKFPFDFKEVNAYLDSIAEGNTAVKAAIDIALNDLQGKLVEKPCYALYGAQPSAMPVTSYTLGMDTLSVIKQKLMDAQDFRAIKVKLGSADDKAIIKTIRNITQLPLYVDANQGWLDKERALDLIHWLAEQGVELVEQPMAKLDIEGNAWLTERSPIPIIADESVQRLKNISSIKGAYHGINIKLMKSTGMYEAHQMILEARKLGMKILIGCMSETSCASLAAAALAPLCDWADIDGPWLTQNNPFETPILANGKYQLTQASGLGLSSLKSGFWS